MTPTSPRSSRPARSRNPGTTRRSSRRSRPPRRSSSPAPRAGSDRGGRAVLQQAFNGLVGGAFYALLALGLAVIFGMLNVVNFAHGACYMLGAFGAFVLLDSFGVNFWVALGLVPVKRQYGVQSQPYPRPSQLTGSINLGLFEYPAYQVFVLVTSLVLCGGVWLVLTRTRVGMIVRAATERPELTRALGIDVARWVTPVFGFGIALAGFAGVLAAPMRAVNPLMGADLIITVFAVVVIGGLGSVFGSVTAGFLIGLVSALGNYYAPALSQTLVFILMAVVLLWRPAGLFGRPE